MEKCFTLPHAVMSKILKCLCQKAQTPRTHRDNKFPRDRKKWNSGEYITFIFFPNIVWCHLLMVSHCLCWPSIYLSYQPHGRDAPPVHVEPVDPFISLILTGRGAKTPAVLPLKEGMTEATRWLKRSLHHDTSPFCFVGFYFALQMKGSVSWGV